MHKMLLHKRITHYRPSSTWMLTFMLIGLIATAYAVDEKSSNTETKSVQTSSTTANSVTTRDEIYIDDEGLEGSGGRGEIHDDLEKEADYSGSGFGPDDEDSTTSHHSTTHHTSSSSSSSSPSSGTGTGTSGSGNSVNNRQDQTNRKDTTRVTEYDLGSGDDDIDHDIDHADYDDNDHDNDNKHNSGVVDGHDSNDNNKKDNEEEDEIYTVVTDPDKIDDHIPDRSGEPGVINKEVPKSNSELDLDLDRTRNQPTDQINTSSGGNEVLIMNTKNEDRTASFFAQPGILAAVIGGAVVGLLCAILVVMFIVYRMRKKDEGSYALDEPKRSPAVNSYAKNGNNREFYA